LEAKYPNELVIIGVHSPKFPHERKTENIRKAILRYGVDHPVVNDANLVLWRRYQVQFWPTFVLFDPLGQFYGTVHGEGLYQLLDQHIGKLVQLGRQRGLLARTPLHFSLERERLAGPLFFPGKVLADAAGKRLFIADSSNHRIVITDLEGRGIAVAGTGQEGRRDGPFAEASFADPQGLAWDGEFLYVADRKNHLIRALDLKMQTVRTVAGTGQQERFALKYVSHAARRIGLNSPWGLVYQQRFLYIGMAGNHQIWRLDLTKQTIRPFAGTGMEEIKDGPLPLACFAQPSGLATDGRRLFVADSESSAIRVLPLDGLGPVRTLVGAGLMEFGDQDGFGPQVRLQHPLDVTWAGGKLYIADTYNNKIKVLDPARRLCETLLGDVPGTFDEPGGVSAAGEQLYVADTGAHRIRVVDLRTREVRTLELSGVPPVRRPAAAGR
jgi:DNA-binding beta-propeller fold protein YncE